MGFLDIFKKQRQQLNLSFQINSSGEWIFNNQDKDDTYIQNGYKELPNVYGIITAILKKSTIIPFEVYKVKSKSKELKYKALMHDGNNAVKALRFKEQAYDKIENSDIYLSSFDFEMPDIDIHFDEHQFNQQMDKLKEQLRNMKSFKFNYKFDREQFEKNMQMMKENLKGCEFFNKEEFQKMMDNINKNLEKSLENINVNIDMDAIDLSLENVKIHMKDLKIDMSHLKEKMKALKGFLKDVKSELIKDGYLDKNTDDFDLDFTKDKIEVNGKKLPDNLLEKYKKIYKDHFGKEINDSFRIKS